MEMEGCIPKLDHAVTIEEMDQGIAEYIRADWARFEAQSRAGRFPTSPCKPDEEHPSANGDC